MFLFYRKNIPESNFVSVLMVLIKSVTIVVNRSSDDKRDYFNSTFYNNYPRKKKYSGRNINFPKHFLMF